MSAAVDSIHGTLATVPTSDLLRAIVYIMTARYSSLVEQPISQLCASIARCNWEERAEALDALCLELDMRIPVR